MRRSKRRRALTLGIDAGGTFTDFVGADGRRVKIPSDPDRSGDVIAGGVAALVRPGEVDELALVHGTTVATNALLTGALAPIGVFITAGFRDLLALGRQSRPELYSLTPAPAWRAPAREFVFEIPERIDAEGMIVRDLDRKAVLAAARRLEKRGVKTAAVCFLHSWRNPRHENDVARILRKRGFDVTASAALVAEFREFERFSTAAANAALRPLLERYVGGLAARFPELAQRLGLARAPRLSIMLSSGGTADARLAAREPVRLVLSGPAGGLVGAWSECATPGRRRLVTLDMGGTSTDVALLDGGEPLVSSCRIAGRPLLVPVLDVHTVGAGGGSIARVDAAGGFRVGPESAGARPGPAAYGQGGPLTVTDANIFLGRIRPDGLLGGDFKIDPARAAAAVAKLARALRMSDEDTALGVIRVAEAIMARALRTISLERGHDPRLFSLVAFGGAGGLHAAALSTGLALKEVVVPRQPGLLSAIGMVRARVKKEASRTLGGAGLAEVEADADRFFGRLERKLTAELRAEGALLGAVFERSVDLRFRGQSYELSVSLGGAGKTAERFRVLFRSRYGFSLDNAIEVVNLRARAYGPEPVRPRASIVRRRGRARPTERVRVGFLEGRLETPVYRRDDLGPGFSTSGPAIVTEYSATTLVPPGFRLAVDDALRLVVEREGVR